MSVRMKKARAKSSFMWKKQETDGILGELYDIFVDGPED